ncbi:MAG TPA: hypothetical protein PLD14_03550 [Candidatus Pacearchaeota archaeon]|nr:hypothetical protein [Candidatus Pacearchaeota archaeon]HPR80271.1 hypothetical protein [Candidatus Pacearchaeota archaeon]
MIARIQPAAPLSIGKVMLVVFLLAIMVSIGMTILQRYPTLADGFLVFIAGIFTVMVMNR